MAMNGCVKVLGVFRAKKCSKIKKHKFYAQKMPKISKMCVTKCINKVRIQKIGIL